MRTARRAPVNRGKIIAPRALDPRRVVDTITDAIKGRRLVLAAPELWSAAGDEREAEPPT